MEPFLTYPFPIQMEESCQGDKKQPEPRLIHGVRSFLAPNVLALAISLRGQVFDCHPNYCDGWEFFLNVILLNADPNGITHKASHTPEPKRADCFPPAVPQCIATGSSTESVYTAMMPKPHRVRR
jgi:hypothetical protein